MNTISANALKVVLVLVGAFIIFIGINVGGGGIQTLRLQGQTDFLEITDEHGYQVQDNHVRFLGGMFGAAGLFLTSAITDLRRYQSGLNVLFALIFMGGLARFTSMRPDIIFSGEIAGSAIAELVLMPILYFWLAQVVKEQGVYTPAPVRLP